MTRIALVHSAYTNADLSGENNVVASQLAFFSKKGFKVKLFTQGNDSHPKLLKQLKLGLNVISSTGFSLEKELLSFKPHLTIIHNTFPNIGMRWLSQWDYPTIIYVHNMRYFCSQGAFVRAGEICVKCVSNSFYAIRYKCFQRSALRTLPLVINQNVQNLPEQHHYFLTVSNNYRDIMVNNGFSEDRVFSLPNFLSAHLVPSQKMIKSTKRNRRWITGGRIATEKGFDNLVKAWPENQYLDIFGEGDTDSLETYLANVNKQIALRGRVTREEFMNHSLNAYGAIIPSKSFEQHPLVEIEFRAAGLPTILKKNKTFAQSQKELNMDLGWETSQNRTFDRLDEALDYISENWEFESEISRQEFDRKYSEKSWFNGLNQILQKIYPNISLS